ncbi:hypothetical protein PhCBS80983_g04749 [Powellomyces hirtus]|uniref:STAS domain-containing protein n=1 Tax=Powellomyces hirtus TaxID=109895 RepID=A0A507DXS7_9FUNG|nr:hypothetical protein PhCBS80983_g04749 [Powellomyces hirtus]
MVDTATPTRSPAASTAPSSIPEYAPHADAYSPPPPQYPEQYPTQFQLFKRTLRRGIKNPGSRARHYVSGLFPIISWLPKYNRTWFAGDVIAGLTVGMVVIPQALAYAKLATLPLEYGLYTSFTGVLLYCFFATSKDVTIGATAVVSQLTGQLLASYNADKQYDPVQFAISMAFLTGIMQLVLGLLRLGIVVDFIPNPVIAGFTSGAGITIIVGQFAGLLGITGVNTNDAAYIVLGHTIRKLKEAKLDAAFGFSSLIFLLLFKFGCGYLTKRGYKWARWVGISRNALVVILFTAISYAVNHESAKPRIRIVGTVPKGFGPIRVPDARHLRGAFSPAITVLIVAVLEHMAVTKSYGRLNGYRPDPNQELVALGATNFLGSFLGGFAATGSFSRSAIKSQSGVRTPLAALFTTLIVVLALYVLTPLFFYIPSATLSAIIVSAISDLISRPALVKQLWDIQFLDLFAFVLAFVLTFFFSIEIAIYVSVAYAVVVLLYRLARPHYAVLGRVDETGLWVSTKDSRMGHTARSPPPGIMVFKLEESLTYPNSNYFADHIKDVVVSRTEFGGKVLTSNDKLWCDDTDRKVAAARKKNAKEMQHAIQNTSSDVNIGDSNPNPPQLHRLRALVFDFSAVNGLDTTGIQMLVDLRRDVDNYAGQRVEFHFAHVRPRFERILSYFLRITRTDRDVTPVVPSPDQQQLGERPANGSSHTLDDAGSIQIAPTDTSSHSIEDHNTSTTNVDGTVRRGSINVRDFFHPTVDDAVAAVMHARDVEAGFAYTNPEKSSSALAFETSGGVR